MSQIWLPGMAAGPLEEFVERVLRLIKRFADESDVEQAYVVVELVDGRRFVLDSISPEPGFGFVTLAPHGADEERDVPAQVIVPVGSIRKIEIDRAAEERGRFGFSAPPA